MKTAWKPPGTAPKDGEAFLAALSDGTLEILRAPADPKMKWSWWAGCSRIYVPVVETHDPDHVWDDDGVALLIGWQELPSHPNAISKPEQLSLIV